MLTASYSLAPSMSMTSTTGNVAGRAGRARGVGRPAVTFIELGLTIPQSLLGRADQGIE